MKKLFSVFICMVAVMVALPTQAKKGKPTIYTIGDSTVKNGQGDGAGGLWGWGDPIQQYFDSSKVNMENHARGGTSSRTFRSLGLWEPVLKNLKKGDFVLIQFGHNDNGALNDSTRARGTIKGIGDETEEIDNILTGKHETVHTYGWYLTQYVREIKKKGATPVIIAPIPRNDWENGHVPRNDKSYGLWAKQVAGKEGVLFINLNDKMASAMEKLGEENVTEVLFFKRDHTHPSAKGAVLAASLVVEGIKESPKCKLNKYLLDNPKINFPVKKRIFLIGDSTVADGKDSIIGWGKFLPEFFDTSRVEIINKARGGRSSRSYLYEGLWKEVKDQLRPGDFVLMQFGHNDGGSVDKEKYRGSLKGNGDEKQEVVRVDSTHETVHTYGWYMRNYINETKAAGAIPIVFSHIPRNEWPNGKVERCASSYGCWVKEAAEQTGAFFVDLNEMVSVKYEAMGQEVVKQFFPKDHTHTNADGAKINAQTVAECIKDLHECPLRGYIEILNIQ
jgi:lysophospholipase L1-like esterase